MALGGALTRSTWFTTLALAVVCACASVPAAARAAASKENFGVNAGRVMDLPPEQRDAHLAAMARANLGVVRVDASWSTIELDAPDPATGAHQYRWAKYDDWVSALARHGLRWYPLLAYSTPWASSVPGDQMAPPADHAQYAAFAGALAARYGSRGTFWAEHPELPHTPVQSYEIWNEPNAQMFWRTQADAPEVYADLYLAARSAIKAVDPSGQAVTAGLLDASAGDVHDFLRRMVRHRPALRTNVDAVGYHPYQQDYDAVLNGIAEFRRTMSLVGLGNVGLEITEIGMTTAWVPESTRASALSRLARELPAAAKDKVTRYMPYEWLMSRESETAPDPQNFHQWWGMVRSDTSLTPTATAYAAAVNQAITAKPKVKKRVLKKNRKKTKRVKFSARSRAKGAKAKKQRRTLEARASSAVAF